MADMQENVQHKQNKKQKRKKQPIKIDFTPMVDLGFLLITFFVFTTTLTAKSVMKLNLPADGPASQNVGESTSLTLVLDKNKVDYYEGSHVNDMKYTNYSANGLRSQILLKQEKITHQTGDNSKLYIIIKATDNSTYKNVVDVLDEMLINKVSRYVLTNAEDIEINKMKS